MAPFVHVDTDMFYLAILWSTSLRRLPTEWSHHFEHKLGSGAFLNFASREKNVTKDVFLCKITDFRESQKT